MKATFLIFPALILINAFSAFAEFDLKIVNPEEESHFRSALKEIKADLPEEVKDTLDREIIIKFSHLNEKHIKQFSENCTEKLTLAKVRRSNQSLIEVDYVHMSEWNKPLRKISCAHPTNHQYVKATIIHEIFHLYDNQKKISKDKSFLNLAGFVAQGLVIKSRTNLNQLESRSPDRYEFKNSMESIAVNFEHFIYDPTYKCRRPVYYDYLAEKLKATPHLDSNCESNKKITMSSQGIEGRMMTRSLDMNRLYQVHYLFAGKGEAVMSRWGHSMFRLVMCAPGKEIGPSCLNDISHHIVISFRANIEDLKMDYADGIKGKYPSMLFFLSLTDVLEEYNKGEFREVFSLPLNLTDEEKERFLLRSTEMYWSYKGKYYFFTNNCASESMNLLRVALKDHSKVQTKNINTPLAMYNYLIKSKIGDASVLEDKALAISKGLYFPSAGEKLGPSMEALGLKKVKFAKFVEDNDSLKRRSLYEAALAKSNNKTKTAANALRLEDLIVKSLEIRFTKELGAKVFGDEPDPRLKDSDLGEKIIIIQKLYKELSAENYIKAGYGIPLEEEFSEIPQEKIDEVLLQLKNHTNDIKTIAETLLLEELGELKEAMENRVRLLNIIIESNR